MIALCFIISYRQILHKEDLWRKWIYPNRDIINVYFHCKNARVVASNWIRENALPRQYTQATSYTNVVPAYMALMLYAYRKDPNNQWMCMLTDSCVPIITPRDFRSMYYTYHYKSIIRCIPSYWNIDIHSRGNLKYLDNKYHLANDPWFTLSRRHVHLCYLFMKLKKHLYTQINSGGIGNESLFAIILRTTDEMDKDTMLNASATLSDWTRMAGPTSPYFFETASLVNITRIRDMLKQNPHAMFLRKISAAFPDNVLTDLANERQILIPVHDILITFKRDCLQTIVHMQRFFWRMFWNITYIICSSIAGATIAYMMSSTR